MKDWVIVLSGSRTLVGKYDPDVNVPVGMVRLSPVYDMSVTASQHAGNMQIVRTCFPILLYGNITALLVSRDLPMIGVEQSLLPKELEDLEARIRGAEEMRTALRAAASRIELAR